MSGYIKEQLKKMRKRVRPTGGTEGLHWDLELRRHRSGPVPDKMAAGKQ